MTIDIKFIKKMDPEHILSFWFNGNKYNEFWFDKSVDNIIIQNYSLVLDEIEKK
jgi:hypothetical protein